MNIEEKISSFKAQCEAFKEFPPDMVEDFFEYWTEPNRSGTRLRWELERTWHTKRRLQRWARTNFKSHNLQPKRITGFEVKKKEPETELEHLRAFFSSYRERPSRVPFEHFGKWYDFMRGEGMLKKFTPEEVNNIRNIYGADNYKCRCAVVEISLTQIANNGRTI